MDQQTKANLSRIHTSWIGLILTDDIKLWINTWNPLNETQEIDQIASERITRQQIDHRRLEASPRSSLPVILTGLIVFEQR